MKKTLQNRMSKGIRVDPAPRGIMLVSEDLGGMQVYIPYDEIQSVVSKLKKIMREMKY